MRICDFSSDVCSSDLAVTWLHPQDGRPVFACPWETAVFYGTTDLDHQDKLHAPHASTEELDYLIAGLRMQFPELGLRASDALAVYAGVRRSEEHTSELQSRMRISYAVFCLKKKREHYNVRTRKHKRLNSSH